MNRVQIPNPKTCFRGVLLDKEVLDRYDANVIESAQLVSVLSLRIHGLKHPESNVPPKDRSFVVMDGKEEEAKDLIARGLIYEIGTENGIMVVGLTDDGVLVYELETI